MCVLQDGLHRSSRCKPGDRNFRGATRASHKRASGVWEEEINVVGKTPPIADAFATREDHTREQGKEEDEEGWQLTRVVVIRSIPSSQ